LLSAADKAPIFKRSIRSGSERFTLSIGDISFPSSFDTSLAREVTDVTPVTPITSSMDRNTSGNSGDISTQESLPPADGSGANTDFDRFQADLKVQAAPTMSRELGNDLGSLLKDLASGNTSAAKADVSKVQLELHTQDTSSVGNAPTGSPLDTLVSKISDSLNSGSVPGTSQDVAQHDLANLLVENGRGTGSLINTSA
jgi:hypothetical protein